MTAEFGLDAARVDGTSELGIFGRIMLPLTRPALATLGILTILGSWNNFLWPLVIAHTILDVVAFIGYTMLRGKVSWLP